MALTYPLITISTRAQVSKENSKHGALKSQYFALLKILKEHRDENNYLKIELQCLSDIANYEHTEKVIDERELKLLIKTVFSYINNPELKVLIR